MKKTNVLLVFTLLAILLSSFVGKAKCEKSRENHKVKGALSELRQPFITSLQPRINSRLLCLDEITFIELEEEIDLGFDTAEYLPLGFNPYEGMIFDLDDIEYITLEEEIDLGFDTADYLPLNFDAYEGMGYVLDDIVDSLKLDDIMYLVEDEEIDLGFDTHKYLPKGFDACAK